MIKIIKQAIIIAIIGIILGVFINLINPDGVAFKEKPQVIDSTGVYDLRNFRNDPYDTTGAKKPSLFGHREKNKQGFYDPAQISAELAKQFFDINALFVDGRPEADFKAGHIKGAINIPYEGFLKLTNEQKVELTKKYNKDGIIVTYCSGGSCDVSIDIAYELGRLGFTGVNIYKGGYSEWESKGYPVEK